MPSELQDAKELIDLTKVAERLGVSPIFLRWSLEAGLPLTLRCDGGRLRVAIGRGESEGDPAAQEGDILAVRGEKPQSASAQETIVATPARDDDEITYLRRRLEQRDAHLAEVQSQLTALALRLADLGETALSRSFGQAVSHAEVTPHVPLPKGGRGAAGTGGTAGQLAEQWQVLREIRETLHALRAQRRSDQTG